MRHPPTKPYSGLTIIASHPSRFDLRATPPHLISGYVSNHFAEALQPFTRHECDIRDAADKSPLLPGTKCVLHMGDSSVPDGYKLTEIRGSPIVIENIPHLWTFHHQDAFDIQPYEKTHNPTFKKIGGTSNELDSGDDEDGESGENETAKKDRSKTRRRNFGFWFKADVAKSRRICQRGIRPNTATYITSAPSAVYIEALQTATAGTLYLDIETDPVTQFITCIGFSFDAVNIYVFPFVDWRGQFVFERPVVCRFMAELAAAFKRNTVIVHNALYDLSVLLFRYKIAPPPIGQIECTMSMMHRMHVGIAKSLGHCVSLFTDQKYHKNEGIFDPKTQAQWQQFLLYNAKDVETLALIHTEMHARARGIRGMVESFRQVNDSLRVYLTMSFRGLRLDTDALCATIDEMTRRCDFFETRVMPRLVGYQLNPRSPVQVAKYLYNELKLKPPAKELTGEKTLQKLRIKYDIPAIAVILAVRGWSKDAGTLKFRLYKKNRLTCLYKVTGTDTFRLSSSKLFAIRGQKNSGVGTNCQNWRKNLRKLVIPDGDNTFVQPDQAGAEALIVAYLCQPGRFRDIFIHKIKPHVFVALHLFQKQFEAHLGRSLAPYIAASPANLRNVPGWSDVEAVIKDSDNWPASRRYYFIAKCVCHGSNYGAQAFTLALEVLKKSEGTVALTDRDAQIFLNIYHNLFPELKVWHDAVRKQLYATRILRNLYGYPRTFYGPLDDTLFRAAYAFIPQSTVGTITNVAATEIQRNLDNRVYTDFELLQNNHDSLLAQTHPERALEVGRIIQQHLGQKLVGPHGDAFVMRSGVSVGPNWKEMKEI